jgi:hypothetical protein
MTRTIGALIACLLAAAAAGEEVRREIAWGALKQQGALPAGEVRPADGVAPFERLVIGNGPEPRTVTLLDLRDPGLTGLRYALRGQVRYDGVEGKGYLEMWSEIPGRGRFFSRTLESAGPMGAIEGTSGWRPMRLSFDATGAAPPSRLTVNLVLPGRGTVELGPLALVQYADSEDATAAPGAWWGPRAAGLAGGIAGSVIGSMGALIGILASRGRGRVLAVGLLKLMMAVGAVALAVGAVALVRSQPYEVFYPLLLEGVVCLGLPLFLLPVVRRRYADIERRRMAAQDLGAPASR